MSGPAPNERSAPLSIRFTASEKARLRTLAGSAPLGRYIREQALGGDARPRAARRNPVRDAEPLGRLLALLGQSRLASNLNRLAKAANQGSLPVTEEVEADLRRACSDIFEMRALLLQALGLQIIAEVKAARPDFAHAASGQVP